MLKIIQVGNALPLTYVVDSSSEFQSGQIAQLKLVAQDIVAGLSDGTAPIGIIDDTRTEAFTQTVIDEVVIIQGINKYFDGYKFRNGYSAKQELNNSDIVENSFTSTYDNITLNSKNGVVTLPVGSELNWDADNDGYNDSVKLVVNYVYRVTNLPGDDTTMGSNRITIWFQRGLYATDQFDSLKSYVLNCTLFVNSEGKLTSEQPTVDHPGIAICTGPPSALNSMLEFMLL